MNATFTQQQPQGLTDDQLRRQFNKDYATAIASGDPRYQMKQMDRPGMSRGAGQMNMAGIKASQDVADGIAAAYSNALQGRQYNANLGLDASANDEQFGQALLGLRADAAYADQMAALQRQQAMTGALRGLMG